VLLSGQKATLFDSAAHQLFVFQYLKIPPDYRNPIGRIAAPENFFTPVNQLYQYKSLKIKK